MEFIFGFCVQIYSSILDINIWCGEISFSLKYIFYYSSLYPILKLKVLFWSETKKTTKIHDTIVHYLEVITSGLSNWVRNTLHWRKKLRYIVEVHQSESKYMPMRICFEIYAYDVPIDYESVIIRMHN